MTKVDYHDRVRDVSKSVFTGSLTLLTIIAATLGLLGDAKRPNSFYFLIMTSALSGIYSIYHSIQVFTLQGENKDLSKIAYGKNIDRQQGGLKIMVIALGFAIAVLLWESYNFKP